MSSTSSSASRYENCRWDRREFLQRASIGICSAAGVSAALNSLGSAHALSEEQSSETAPTPEEPPVIDTHLHCFAGTDDPRFPYHEKAPYRPSEPATPEHLLACMEGAGVDYAVVVHPEPYQDDHRYLEHCLKVGGERLKGTCLFFADRPGSLKNMRSLVEKFPGRIIAARIHAYAPERLPPFGTPELKQLWRTADELGLAVQLHLEPRFAPALEPYIREFRQTTVIIDHLGRPFQGTPKEHAVVVKWSRFPNTVMKIAALPDRRSYPHRDITPIIKTLTDAYGADRMICGGGYNASATPQSYHAYRERVRSYLDHLSADDQAKIFGGTADRLFQFAPSPPD